MNDICFELSSSWQSDFDTTPIKLQRIRHRQRLPPQFLRKLRGKVRENLKEVANAYRSKDMCALSRPAAIQTCLSSSATPILIRPEELRTGLLVEHGSPISKWSIEIRTREQLISSLNLRAETSVPILLSKLM